MKDDERPLHVRVAEALGCHPMQGYGFELGAWFCGCEPPPTHAALASPHPFLFRYDTDWSATGPLIEKYDLRLVHRTKEQSGDELWMAEIQVPNDIAYFTTEMGETPLIAICNLILTLHEKGKL